MSADHGRHVIIKQGSEKTKMISMRQRYGSDHGH